MTELDGVDAQVGVVEMWPAPAEILGAAGSAWRGALLSDGAAAAVDTYGVTDWHGVLELLDARGPKALLESVRKIETDDPDARRYPRIKRSDDATVAYLTGAPE